MAKITIMRLFTPNKDVRQMLRTLYIRPHIETSRTTHIAIKMEGAQNRWSTLPEVVGVNDLNRIGETFVKRM